MMVCYLRSSSIGTLGMCEMQYFFQYTLGFKGKTNKKAVLGTIMHRALQVLGDKKVAQTNNKRKVKNDDIEDLTLKQCDDIDYITTICFDHYKKHETEVDLTPADLRQCIRWVNKAITYNDCSLDPRNQGIDETELFFDIEIKEDWAKYEYVINGETISGYLSIKGTVDVIIKEDDNYFRVLDYKGLPVGTEIPTPDGWKTMGDLEVGDTVFDQYGQQTQINGKSQQKIKDCYKITFDDTSTVVCDDEHYWKLLNGDTVQIKDLAVGDRISVAKPLDCGYVDLPIDPYTLGIWLGDGRNKNGEICSGDDFIFETISSRGFDIGGDLDKNKPNAKSRTIYKLRTSLRENNLLHNKHIPEIYFRASYDQRLDLLRGLMDSDGSVNVFRKQCVFMNCNKALSNDVKHLLLTLGQRPLLSKTTAKGFGLVVDAYPVSFRPVDINPFLLPKKRDKVNPEWGSGHSHRRKIISIEKDETQLTQCISVDSEDKTYLCTRNMIPTHNSGKRLNWATGKEKTYECLTKDPQLLLYYYALKRKFPEREFYVSIFYVNDGGIFDIAFDDDDYLKAENMLKQKFEYIKSVQLPNQISKEQTHWKCKYLCAFSEINEETGKTTCNEYHDMIKSEGIDVVTAKYGNTKKLTTYGSGGGVIAKDD